MTPTINLDTSTYERLTLVAATLGVSDSEAVAELLRRLATPRATEPHDGDGDGVAIHVVYNGARVEGTFDPSTKSVTITTGPLAGKLFKSPSAAAIAVVSHLNPDVHPNRNGWSFWFVSATNQVLQTIRHR